MAFKDFPAQEQGVRLLQRSLERGRLAHAYLFTDSHLDELENLARTLAKTLNCLQPLMQEGRRVDCCDTCLSCRKIEHANHPDLHWIRPESKTRIIKIDQIRQLIQELNLKPTEAEHKVAVIVAADRLKMEAANAFLKTLEEPPANSILVLLSTRPEELLETIRSRCLRLRFAGEHPNQLPPAQRAWLGAFSEMAAVPHKSLLGRYRLMDVLLRKLTETKQSIEQALKARSPLEQYEEAEKEVRERWEDELAAAVEAEYRRQRGELLGSVQWWLRDVWLRCLNVEHGSVGDVEHKSVTDTPHAPHAPTLLSFPDLPATQTVARRISPRDALANLASMEQLQRWLGTNVQEALAIEVGLLKLHL
jgi:DNA polymerase-3 subunit delta'